MAQFDFTLALRGVLTEETVNALFESGCDDMTFHGDGSGPAYADVTREATDFYQAALSAIRDIEAVESIVVEAIDAGEFVNASEIADRLGISREGIRLLIAGERGPGGFPAPHLRLRARTKLWLWSEVAVWSNEHRGTTLERGFGPEAESLNTALALRHGEPSSATPGLHAIHELVGV